MRESAPRQCGFCGVFVSRLSARAAFFLPDDVHTTMNTSRNSARSDSSAKTSIGYSSNRSDMAVSIKNEHCMRFVGAAGAWLGALSMAAILAACGGGGAVRPVASPPTGAAIIPGQIAATRLTAVAWQQVPGWQDDSLIGATAALRQNCLRLARQANWARACAAAAQLDDLDVTGA